MKVATGAGQSWQSPKRNLFNRNFVMKNHEVDAKSNDILSVDSGGVVNFKTHNSAYKVKKLPGDKVGVKANYDKNFWTNKYIVIGTVSDLDRALSGRDNGNALRKNLEKLENSPGTLKKITEMPYKAKTPLIAGATAGGLALGLGLLIGTSGVAAAGTAGAAGAAAFFGSPNLWGSLALLGGVAGIGAAVYQKTRP